ncbi:MAG: asparagine synthase (glutamine-hydrolyzing) [Desulfovibrionales bacterium GWA2_65_9]|nr:MAG: asparagine synthase (glutamine-hydrolyzing) [Desulfovibrionales bacterium GWA2_65_9]
MCGIAGIAGRHDPELVRRMCRVLAHRGPDGEGFHEEADGSVGLGHRRLSILDLEGGAQPMHSADNTLCIVFNGEIFNAPELRRELEAAGRRFATRNSDTEVLLHLYQEHGAGMLDRLRGMYAFCLLDSRTRRLFLARDRAGIKPLYFSRAGGRFAFASELKALIELPWISRAIRAESLAHYLSLQFVPAPGSILADVDKLPAGHWLSVDLPTLNCRQERFWSLSHHADDDFDIDAWAVRCREALSQAVRRWTLSDVPLACSLSGGLDSSAIVGLLAPASPEPLRTYSLGFSGGAEGAEASEAKEIDELDLARQVAARFGTSHHEIRMDAEALIDDLERMVWHLDEPYGGGLPSWYVYRLIGQDVKVALTGTGGDELFGNYGKWLRFEAAPDRALALALEQTREQDAPALRRALERHPHGALYHRYLTDASKSHLLCPAVLGACGETTEALIERLWREADRSSARDAVPALDFQLQLPEEFLLVTDRFAMAHGVEARVPFLDEDFVALVSSVPASLRTRPDNLKYLLKRAVADLLPPALLESPKRGFVLPLTAWTRGRLRGRIEAALAPERLERQGLFTRAAWDQVVAPHLSGAQERTQQVWTLFMFQLWHERFVGAN